jgi:hypothetical protein
VLLCFGLVHVSPKTYPLLRMLRRDESQHIQILISLLQANYGGPIPCFLLAGSCLDT